MTYEFNEKTLIAITTPLYTLVIGCEILFSHWQSKKYYNLKDTLINIFLTISNASIDVLFRGIYLFIILQWFYDHHFVNFAQHQLLYWFLLFIFEDFVFYIEHTVDNYCRFSGRSM